MKRWTSMRILVAIASLLASLSAHAGFLNLFNADVNILTVNLGTGAGFSGALTVGNDQYLDVKFTGDKSRFNITVIPLYSFADTFFDDSKHLKLQIDNDFWNLTFVLDFTDLVGDATFRAAANVMHTVRPDGIEHLMDADKGDPFLYSFSTISAQAYRLIGNAAIGALTLNPTEVDHLPTHKDRYSGKVGYDLNYGADHFNGWDFQFRGNHIPEPDSLLLLIAGIGLMLLRGTMRQKTGA